MLPRAPRFPCLPRLLVPSMSAASSERGLPWILSCIFLSSSCRARCSCSWWGVARAQSTSVTVHRLCQFETETPAHWISTAPGAARVLRTGITLGRPPPERRAGRCRKKPPLLLRGAPALDSPWTSPWLLPDRDSIRTLQ